MSAAVDANVLLHASNAGDRRFDDARRLLERLASGPALLYLPLPVLLAYLRIGTQPRILSPPLSLTEALSNVNALTALPHARILQAGERHWSILTELLRSTGWSGRRVSDAQLAALLLEHGVRRLYTYDSDFKVFDFLEVVTP